MPSEKRKKGWRRGAKAGAAAGVAAASMSPGSPTAFESLAPSDPPPPPPGGPAVEGWAPGAPGLVAADDHPWFAVPADDVVDGGLPPASGGSFSPPEADGAPPAKRSKRTLVLLLVLLLVVIGGIVYFAAKKNDNNTTAVTAPTTPTASSSVADAALAASINLRLTDLPTGWSPSPTAGQVARPPATPGAAQVQADQALASCLNVAEPTVAGLFGVSALPGQTASVRSPTFQGAPDGSVQMHSTAIVMSTAAQATALTTPFTNPNFLTCFGRYQTALISAVVPGATASVSAVTLSAPAGVTSFGYLTTLTIPNQGSEIIGEGFMTGGRIETKLEPTTNGPAVPSEAFDPAYNAIVGRIAAAVNK